MNKNITIERLIPLAIAIVNANIYFEYIKQSSSSLENEE